jgi:hypothetical protein
MANYKPFYTSFNELKELYPKIDSLSLSTANIHGIYVSKAEGYIHSKLAKMYTVPFTSSNIPPLVKSISQDLSMYYILRRIYTQNKKDKNPWIDEWKLAIDILDELASGEMVLVDNSGEVISARTDQTQIWSNVTDYKPTMDHRGPEWQRVDPDRLEDEDDADNNGKYSSILS